MVGLNVLQLMNDNTAGKLLLCFTSREICDYAKFLTESWSIVFICGDFRVMSSLLQISDRTESFFSDYKYRLCQFRIKRTKDNKGLKYCFVGVFFEFDTSMNRSVDS